MGIEQSDFQEFSRTEGKLKIDVMGQHDEMPYTSRNFLNPEGTIGCAEVDVNGKAACMFISKTEKGVVMTMVGEGNGPFPIPVEGYHSIMCVGQECGFEDSYKAHQDAIEGMQILPDPGWLRTTVPDIPRRALDAAMKAIQGATGLVDGMMQEMGQALGQVMEGVAKGFAEAAGGIAGAAVPEAPKKARKAGKAAKPARKSKAAKPKKKGRR